MLFKNTIGREECSVGRTAKERDRISRRAGFPACRLTALSSAEPLLGESDMGLESPENRQAGKPALRMLRLAFSAAAIRSRWLLFGVLSLLLLSWQAVAQEVGAVAGVVISTWDGTPLGGTAVTVRGTTLATQSGADGRFELKNVPIGDQTLRFSKSGFASAVVTDVRVIAGQTTTVNGNLRPEFYEMEEFEVTAEEFTQQTEQILIERQQSSGMMEAIGSDSFKNLAVSDAAGALSKVTGASIADGKYAVVRGLADRYTFTTLNGMELPSADPDRKAFQLDLMPSKFIQQMDVRKTFTPDMSGGFAGGSIDIVSKSFPEKFLFEWRVSTAYNTQSSLRDDFAASDQSSTDWMAMDDGLRAMPEEIAATSPASTAPALTDQQEALFRSRQFAPVNTDSPLDSGTELLVGFSRDLFGMRLGALGGFNYKQSYQYFDDGIVRDYGINTDKSPSEPVEDKTERRGTIEYQWGGLVSLALELNEHHELKFNFVNIQAAEDKAQRLQGLDPNSTAGVTYMDQSVLHWTERNLQYLQLAGGHEVPDLNGVRLDWGAAKATTSQADPDFRIFQFLAEEGFNNPDVSGSPPGAPTRYWRELTEENLNLRLDLTVPLPSYNSGDNAIKGGVALSQSERDFAQRGFQMTRERRGRHPFIDEGDPNIWTDPENLQFVRYRNFQHNLTYAGKQDVEAVYLMADWAALDWLQLVGGARYETTDLSISGVNQTQLNTPLPSGQIKQGDLLPSLSAKFQIRENIDLRAAWSQTIVRPTYREIAFVPMYDVTQSREVIGNPGLSISESENYDLRLSWYPRPGEIVSVSGFAKTLTAPIELAGINTDNKQVTYLNFEKADVLGFEGEARVGLDRIWKGLKPFTVGVNGAYITSEVPLTGDFKTVRRDLWGDRSESRPLYNQPDFILNGDLTWELEQTRTTVTLSGGVVGENLVLIGYGKPDEYAQPAPELNLFIRQRLGKNWDVRFTAKNLLNPEHQVVQHWPSGDTVLLRSYTKGITFGLSVGCEF